MGERLVPFDSLLSYPLRSGVTVAKASRGSGIRMVNMRELFKYPRLGDVDMARVRIDTTDEERFLLRKGDLLFARRSLTAEGAGKCSLIVFDQEATTWESSIIRARLDSNIAQPEYYYYFFSSSVGRRSIETIIEQVAAAGIRSSDLAKLMVPLPSKTEQRAVAAVLGALDDKIAINNQIGATQEQLFRARFQELQIDVEPESQSTIAVSELIEFNPRLPAPSSMEAAYLEMSAVPTGAARVQGWSRREPRSGTRFSNGDTVMARITPCLENGKVAFIDFMSEGEVGVGSTEFIVMRARAGFPTHLSYFLARSPRFQENAIRNMVGSSGRQRVGAAQLVDFPVSRPDMDELSIFGKDSSVAFDHMKALDAESNVLMQLRDTLLPGLMSGEIRVRDAETTVGDVT